MKQLELWPVAEQRPKKRKARAINAWDERCPVDWEERQYLALPEEMEIIEPFADQPANMKSRKPARLIVLYTRGVSRQDVLDDLNISERDVERYFARWIIFGVDGLIQLHSGLGKAYC